MILKYTKVLFFLAFATTGMAQSSAIHSARISITMRQTEFSNTSYQRLLGEEALAFDLAQFLKDNHQMADIKISGSMVKDQEVIRLSFDKADWNGDCYQFCETTTSVEKLPLMGVATIPAEGIIKGVLVQRVITGSAAQKAGIQPNDIITNIEGETIYSGCDLHTVINGYTPGDALDVDVIRQGKNLSLPVVLGYKLQRKVKWTTCCANPVRDLADINNTQVSHMEVFPNPTTAVAQLKFRSEIDAPLSIRVTDITGRVLYQNEVRDFSGFHDQAIDLTGQAGGMYFLYLTQNGKVMTEKIVLQERK